MAEQTAEDKLRTELQEVARFLDNAFNEICGERMGFVLSVAPLGRTGAALMVANVTTEGAVTMLRGALASREALLQQEQAEKQPPEENLNGG